MNYLRAVLNSDKKSEIANLEKLIEISKKLNKDTKEYEKELAKLSTSKANKTTKDIKPKEIKKTSTNNKKEVTKKVEKKDSPKYKNSTYNIDKVYVKDNTIVVNFKHYIKKDYIKFIEEKRGSNFYKIFDFKGRFEDASPTKLVMKGVDKIKITQHKYRTLRIEFKDRSNLKMIYILNKKQIIIKVLDNKKNNNKKATLAPSKNKEPIKSNAFNQNRFKTIVIDSGHGGKDSGAVGIKKRYEKHAVLKVSKYLSTILKQRGYKVYTTRERDKFIKVKNRTVLANKKKADVFISIHANAAPKSVSSKARGIETYFLSPARGERAKRVAALENKSDMREMNYTSKNTFLTILNQNKITQSQKLGIDVQQHLLHSARKLYKDVVDGGVREGPFWVLVGAQMPSILVEIGYITHKEESRRLFESRYQKKLAIGIANGIDSYFAKNQ